MRRARVGTIVSPSANMPLAPARDLGVYASFASRPRATLAFFRLRARARHGALLCSGLPHARSRATCVSSLKWGSTRAPVRDRGQYQILVLLLCSNYPAARIQQQSFEKVALRDGYSVELPPRVLVKGKLFFGPQSLHMP